jgi:hypothetical protein
MKIFSNFKVWHPRCVSKIQNKIIQSVNAQLQRSHHSLQQHVSVIPFKDVYIEIF